MANDNFMRRRGRPKQSTDILGIRISKHYAGHIVQAIPEQVGVLGVGVRNKLARAGKLGEVLKEQVEWLDSLRRSKPGEVPVVPETPSVERESPSEGEYLNIDQLPTTWSDPLSED